jgi:hypothetical protein
MRVTEFMRRVSAEGWSVATRPGGHLELSHPLAGEMIITSATPSDHRWLANTRARMRRALPAAPKAVRAVKPRPKRRPPARRPAPLRSWTEPIPMHQIAGPERRLYPDEPALRRPIAGAPRMAATRW